MTFKNFKIVLFLAIIMISYSNVKSQENSTPLYTKVIYKKEFENSVNSNFPSGKFEISIEAQSSSNYKIIIEKYDYNFQFNNGKIVLDKFQFEKFTNALNKYIEWDKIVKENNIEVEKEINRININSKSVSKIKSNYRYKVKEIIFKYTNFCFILEIHGDYSFKDTNYYYNKNDNYDYYGKIVLLNIYDVKKIHFLLTGVSFKEILKEIDKKIKVWDELK